MVMVFDVTVTGVAQLMLVVSLQLIRSPLARPDKTTVVRPEVPGMISPFLSHSMVGEPPWLFAVRVKVAVCPWQISLFGEEIDPLWVRLAFTVM